MKAVKYLLNTSQVRCDRCTCPDRHFVEYRDMSRKLRFCIDCACCGEEDFLPEGLETENCLSTELFKIGKKRKSMIAWAIATRFEKGFLSLEDLPCLTAELTAAELLPGLPNADRRDARALRKVLERW